VKSVTARGIVASGIIYRRKDNSKCNRRVAEIAEADAEEIKFNIATDETPMDTEKCK
jgi:hypothetical protein